MSNKPPLHYYVFTPRGGQGQYYKGYGFLDLQTDSLIEALDRFHELKEAGYQPRFEVGLSVNEEEDV